MAQVADPCAHARVALAAVGRAINFASVDVRAGVDDLRGLTGDARARVVGKLDASTRGQPSGRRPRQAVVRGVDCEAIARRNAPVRYPGVAVEVFRVGGGALAPTRPAIGAAPDAAPRRGQYHLIVGGGDGDAVDVLPVLRIGG